MRMLINTILLLAATMLSSRLFADKIKDSGEVDSLNDIGSVAAESIASKISAPLKSEKSKVIFLNLSTCTVTLEDHWCQNFLKSLESSLIKNRFVFLPEASKEDIRSKIASEQVYQQNSMNVDLSKAVALGQQKAFHAFLTIGANSNEKGEIKVNASSVNIRDGVVSVAENITVKTKQDVRYSSDSSFKNYTLIGLGSIGVIGGYFLSDKEKQKASDSYRAYKRADNVDDAIKFRKDVEKHDGNTKYYQYLTIGGGLLAVYGLFSYVNSKEEIIAYKITEFAPNSSYELAVAPFSNTKSIGLNLEVNW